MPDSFVVPGPDSSVSKVVVPGTYDPITNGHKDVILRATRLFPQVIVGVAASPSKRGGPTFPLDERLRLVREVFADEPRIEVEPFSGLLMEFAAQHGAKAVVKGLRQLTDFEHEFQQAELNWHIDRDIETVFIMSSPKFGYISSSIAKELYSLGGDVSEMVPEVVKESMEHHVERLV